MSMRQTRFRFSMAVVVALVLSGCGGGSSPTNPTPPHSQPPPASGVAGGSIVIRIVDGDTITATIVTGSLSAGVPVMFTLDVSGETEGTVVTIDWGDGTGQVVVAAINGESVFSHVYSAAGNFVLTVTLKDTSGKTGSFRASVFVR